MSSFQKRARDSLFGNISEDEDTDTRLPPSMVVWRPIQERRRVPMFRSPVPVIAATGPSFSILRPAIRTTPPPPPQYAQAADRPSTSNNEYTAFACPVCFEEYSPTHHPPVLLTSCGHSVCKLCLARIRTCGVCSTPIQMGGSSATSVPPNYSLLHLREEMDSTHQEELKRQSEDFEKKLADARTEKEVLEQQLRERNDSMVQCAGCKDYEKESKMRICVDCASVVGVSETSTEEKLLPFVLCAGCTLDNHNDHQRIHYVPWKTRHIVTTAATEGATTVGGMLEVCDEIYKKAKTEMDRWLMLVRTVENSEHSSHKNASMEAAREISALLRDDAETLSELADKALPHLRMMSKVATESCARLEDVTYIRDPTMVPSSSRTAKTERKEDRVNSDVTLYDFNVAQAPSVTAIADIAQSTIASVEHLIVDDVDTAADLADNDSDVLVIDEVKRGENLPGASVRTKSQEQTSHDLRSVEQREQWNTGRFRTVPMSLHDEDGNLINEASVRTRSRTTGRTKDSTSFSRKTSFLHPMSDHAMDATMYPTQGVFTLPIDQKVTFASGAHRHSDDLSYALDDFEADFRAGPSSSSTSAATTFAANARRRVLRFPVRGDRKKKEKAPEPSNKKRRLPAMVKQVPESESESDSEPVFESESDSEPDSD